MGRPLEYNEDAIDSIYSTMIFDSDFCPTEYESYVEILDKCISEVDTLYRSIVSELEKWCIVKIDSKIDYGYNYDAKQYFNKYFVERKYVNIDSFVKFTNPAVFNLIH